MLAFLIGTSILNVFIGYALAVYLMRASHEPLERPASPQVKAPTPAATSTLARGESIKAAQDDYDSASAMEADLKGSGRSSIGSTTEVAPSENGESSPDSAGDNRGADEMDQQLLAGIADFRSQLAKLRSESGTEDPKRRPAARTTPK